MLGVYIIPTLCWNGQFEVMRKKADESIIKLINTNINIDQAYTYFNVYFTTSIYFRTGIVQLNEKQEAELKRIYKVLIL